MAIEKAASENAKGKQVVSADDKSKAVVEPRSAPKRARNYEHCHEEDGPTHFCEFILALTLVCQPMPLDFTKHYADVPQEFKLKTNTGCTWRVTVWVINGRLTLGKGWNPFLVVHQIRIRYLCTFKLLTPDTLKVIVFNDDGVEVVTKCNKHDEAFTMDV